MYTFIDLFAGVGGMRLAYEAAGCRCVYSNEWNKFSRQTYEANFGEVPDDDITKVDAADIPDHDTLFGCRPDQCRIGIHCSRYIVTVSGKTGIIEDRVPDITAADKKHLPVSVNIQDALYLLCEKVDIIPGTLFSEFSELGKILPDLGCRIAEHLTELL